MKLNPQKFALAAGILGAAWFVFCAVVVILAPQLALSLFGSVVHMLNVDQFAEVQVTLGGFILGLVQVAVYGYVSGWLLAWLYNRFLNS